MDEQAREDPTEQPWLRLLHLLFGVSLLVPCSFLVLDGAPGLALTLALAGGFAAWYAITFAWAPFGRGRGPIAVSIAGIVVFLTILTVREDVFLLVLYSLIPLVFSSLPRIWAVVAMAAMVLTAPLVERDVDRSDIFTFVAIVAIGLVVTAVIEMLAKRTEEQQDVIDALETAQEENARLAADAAVQGRHAGVLAERQRLAHDIHDTLAQSFTSIVAQLEAAEQALGGDTDDAATRIRRAKDTARDGLAEARRTVEALRPASLEEVDLPDALAELAERWSHGLAAPVVVDVVVDGPRIAVPDDAEAALLRVAQEALTNVGRHAGAQRVTITLTYLDDLVLLDVQDDGIGFDPTSTRRDGRRVGFGLTSMRERMALVGGDLSVEGEPGEGTTIAARLPLSTVRPPTPDQPVDGGMATDAS